MNLIPSFIHRRISRRPSLVKIVDNMGWLFFDNVLRMGLGLFVSIWLARYLGPGQFGQLSYATILIGVFGTIAALGLNGIVVRDIVNNPAGSNTTLGTAFFLKLIGGSVAVLFIIGLTSYLRPNDELITTMIVVLSFSLVFKSSEVVKYWFESQLQSRYSVWVENSVFVLIASIKIALIIGEASLIAFVWVILAEAMLVAMGLFGIYLHREKKLLQWSVQVERAKSLLKDSWPMIFMALMLGIYTKIDVFMVEYFLGWDATGLYSAALKVAESWYFIAVVLTNSLYPNLIAAHSGNKKEFKRKLAAFYSLMFWVPVVVTAIVAVFSDDIMIVLYGDKYTGIAGVFSLYIWSSVFVFVITASSRWFLVNNSTKSLMYRATLGAFSNIVLNYFLLRALGLTGAAIATLISYFLVAYIYDLFDRKAHEQFWIKMAAPLYPFIRLSSELRNQKA